MGTKVKVMDIEVDLLTQETCLEELQSYLENDYLNIVHMISLDYIDAYDKNDLVQTTLEEAGRKGYPISASCRCIANGRHDSRLSQYTGFAGVPPFKRQIDLSCLAECQGGEVFLSILERPFSAGADIGRLCGRRRSDGRGADKRY